MHTSIADAAVATDQKSQDWHLRMLALENASRIVSGNYPSMNWDAVAKYTILIAESLYKNYIEKYK